MPPRKGVLKGCEFDVDGYVTLPQARRYLVWRDWATRDLT